MTPRSALLAGATGLVGNHCLRLLLADPAYDRVVVLARRELGLRDPKLATRIVDFDHLAELPDFPAADDVFCCLGTTMRRAGSKPAFYAVDFTYVHALARLARRRGSPQFLLVSAIGADTASRMFYSRVKGEIEQAVIRLAFPGTFIFRPSLLLGRRAASRPGERLGTALARALAWTLVGPLRQYRPIPAEVVAAAMVRAAKAGRPGVHFLTYDDMIGTA